MRAGAGTQDAGVSRLSAAHRKQGARALWVTILDEALISRLRLRLCGSVPSQGLASQHHPLHVRFRQAGGGTRGWESPCFRPSEQSQGSPRTPSAGAFCRLGGHCLQALCPWWTPPVGHSFSLAQERGPLSVAAVVQTPGSQPCGSQASSCNTSLP